MKSLFGVAILLCAAVAGAAWAQPYRGAPRATLYENPGFQGGQIEISGKTENLPRYFNDKAMSGRFEGRWRICEHSDFGGRCAVVEGDVADLNVHGLAQRVSSLRPDDRNDDGRYDTGRYYNGDSRSLEGARNVFFPYPTLRGADIEATSGAADRYCRSQGLAGAAYFDADDQGYRGYGRDDRYSRSGTVLRDVLCRR